MREGEEMRPKKYPYNKKPVQEQARRLVLNKKMLPIQKLEIEISNEQSYPKVILNGIDFKEKNIGLKGLKIDWKTRDDIHCDTVVQVDYLVMSDCFNEVSVRQSFPNTCLKIKNDENSN